MEAQEVVVVVDAKGGFFCLRSTPKKYSLGKVEETMVMFIALGCDCLCYALLSGGERCGGLVMGL